MNTADKEQAVKPADKPTKFVEFVIKKCEQDKGYAARLKRSDNPDTEYQSWETLASFGIDLVKERWRLPYVTIAAAIAKAKVENTGRLSLGKAIASCYEDGNQSDQAKAKLRRLLACQDISELCRILRPLFSLINSKTSQPLDYIKILKQLLKFSWDGQTVKAGWAQEFYSGKSLNQGEK